jgi:hypothetical protein
MKSSFFWDKMMCSLLKVNQCVVGTLPPSSGLKSKSSKNQHEAGNKRAVCLTYSSALKMEAACSSETVANF